MATLPKIVVHVRIVSIRKVRWKTWRITFGFRFPSRREIRRRVVIVGMHGAEVRRKAWETLRTLPDGPIVPIKVTTKETTHADAT
ncbi:hypothetical protein [Zavarzinia sp.]|jgi:hypothetical protein|uniref:hypothetical protein n=1 Tax=Zavarzinia sp. TaxID=2027920 RepID=UPI0035651491